MQKKNITNLYCTPSYDANADLEHIMKLYVIMQIYSQKSSLLNLRIVEDTLREFKHVFYR